MRVLCAGELLVDVVINEKPDSLAMTGHLGGSPPNVAMVLAALGMDSHLATVLGSDPLARFLIHQLEDLGVDHTCCVSVEADTLLAMVLVDSEGKPHYGFRRDERLDRALGPDTFSHIPLSSFGWAHFGSLGLLYPAERRAFTALLERALKEGVLVSVDPNVRQVAGVDFDEYRRFITHLMRRVPLVKASEDDLQLLYGQDGIQELLTQRGAAPTVVTLGPQGALLAQDGQHTRIPAFPARVVDTIGCGDAFMASLIYRLSREQPVVTAVGHGPAVRWPWESLREAAVFASRVAARVAEIPGAAQAARALRQPADRQALGL